MKRLNTIYQGVISDVVRRYGRATIGTPSDIERNTIKQINPTKIGNVIYRSSIALQKQRGQKPIELYDNDLSEYFVGYVRASLHKPFMTASRAMSILNEDFIRGAQAETFPEVMRKGGRSLAKSYAIYESVYAYAQIQIKNKYKADDYQILIDNNNKDAVNLERWAKRAQLDFELLTLKIANDKKHEKRVKLSGEIGRKAKLDAVEQTLVEAGYSKNVLRAIEVTPLIAFECYMVYMYARAVQIKKGTKFDSDGFAKEWGFKNFNSLQGYVDNKLQMLSVSEKRAIFEETKDQVKDIIASRYGIEDHEEAQMIVDMYSGEYMSWFNVGVMEKLNNLTEGSLDAMAKAYGCEDYETLRSMLDEGLFSKITTNAIEKQYIKIMDQYYETMNNIMDANEYIPYKHSPYERIENLSCSLDGVDLYYDSIWTESVNNPHLAYASTPTSHEIYMDLVNRLGSEEANKKLGLEEILGYDNPRNINPEATVLTAPEMIGVVGVGVCLGSIVRFGPYALNVMKAKQIDNRQEELKEIQEQIERNNDEVTEVLSVSEGIKVLDEEVQEKM